MIIFVNKTIMVGMMVVIVTNMVAMVATEVVLIATKEVTKIGILNKMIIVVTNLDELPDLKMISRE